jgi:hypothetical protein
MFQPLYPWERERVAIVEEAGWASRLVWTGAENITPQGNSIPGLFSTTRIAKPTTLSQPTFAIHYCSSVKPRWLKWTAQTLRKKSSI